MKKARKQNSIESISVYRLKYMMIIRVNDCTLRTSAKGIYLPGSKFLRKLGEKKYADPIKFCFHVNFTPRFRGLFRILRKVSLGQHSEFFGSAGKYGPEKLRIPILFT